MAAQATGAGGDTALEHVLGYLNFSSGAADPQLLASLNQLFECIEAGGPKEPTWRVLEALLRRKLRALQQTSPTFRDAEQATAVLDLLFGRVLPDYLQFHRDLLFHQTDRTLFGPFFLGRVCEAVLKQGPPWGEQDRISSGAIGLLNDYIGHRPVAALERQKIQPYPHEWVRPVPLYVRGAGVAYGPYRQVVRQALQLLAETDESLLRAAYFDPDLLDELAVDPRAYDFDHPVNKRPNYHFGGWDPHQIDNQGRYRRFVVQQVTLDALMQRVEQPGGLPPDQVALEAAAVLAGTMLMASGISGSGPDTHDSSVTLASLLPEIAAYRDAFYEQLLQRMTGEHARRLRQEAMELRQPFGGARQHLNSELARRRASQLEHVHLALLFARMGYPEAAGRRAAVVPVASARMRCQIDCRLTAGRQAIQQGDLHRAAALCREILDLLHRAIQCGALIDPWNLLGFDAHFSLFPALENSIHDHRADELVDLMEQIFAFYSRIWSEAAAVDDRSLCRTIDAQFKETADWWRQFAAHELSSIEASDAWQAYRAARHVADAVNLWYKGGAAAGDLGFWAPHADMFDSGKAYALAVDALLERRDFVASMALLIHWLSHAPAVGLEQGDWAFHELALRWLVPVQQASAGKDTAGAEDRPGWKLVKKFFDYLEANADDYWRAPRFELDTAGRANRHEEPSEEDDEDLSEDLFRAAYENVVYRDSSDDGVDQDLLDRGLTTGDELDHELKRITDRLLFLSAVARLWSLVATGPFVLGEPSGRSAAEPDVAETLDHWIGQAAVHRRDLLALLDAVHKYRIPRPRSDHDSLAEYDRRRLTKESLLELTISACVETSAALRHLVAASSAVCPASRPKLKSFGLKDEELPATLVLGCLLRQDLDALRRHWPKLIRAFGQRPLLYVPVAKGGDPRKIVVARIRQQSMEDLLVRLPRLGLLSETCQLLDTARQMERDHPVGPSAVTEFDELFKSGYKAVVRCVVASATARRPRKRRAPSDPNAATSELIGCLEKVTEALLIGWLAHSRTLRLSVLEKVKDQSAWKNLVSFIKRYGKELFTQKFLNLGTLRAILHEGVDAWLIQLEEEEPDEPCAARLLNDLDAVLPREDAVEYLSLILEAIVENYGEYRDYNSTTTQSDRGELLYTLLDFLRLRTQYDRVAWNLKPVVWAHEMLVRLGLTEAAATWRRLLTQRIGQEADKYAARLSRLQKKYAMRMPTVADRIGERFVRPLQIDQLRALIGPAIRAAGQGKPCRAFKQLERETARFTSKPTGVGLDIPAWLIALEDEVEQARRHPHPRNDELPDWIAPPTPVPLEELKRQIDQWTRRDELRED